MQEYFNKNSVIPFFKVAVMVFEDAAGKHADQQRISQGQRKSQPMM